MGHTARACAIGMRIADEVGIDDPDERSALFYALLLKDAGCSSNSARVCAMFGHDDIAIKNDLKTVNYHKLKEALGYITRNIQPDGSAFKRAMYLKDIVRHGTDGSRALTRTRCERGAAIARMLGFDDRTARRDPLARRALERQGLPRRPGRRRDPAVRADPQPRPVDRDLLPPVGQRRGARRGRGAQRQLVRPGAGQRAAEDCASTPRSGATLRSPASVRWCARWSRTTASLLADDERLDKVAEAFAQVIDAKSPYTASHSLGVATIAVGISRVMDEPTTTCATCGAPACCTTSASSASRTRSSTSPTS